MHPFLIQKYVDNHIEMYPKKVALTYPTESYTYKDLWQSANKIANLLRHYNLRRQDRVAIFTKRSPKSIIAMLGVLKADGIYVVIDGKAPALRLKLILNDCSPSFIICDNTTRNHLFDILHSIGFKPKLIILEKKDDDFIQTGQEIYFQDDINRHPHSQPAYQNIDCDLAQIIYTSGSTGKPKGVMISHLNILNYIDWAVSQFQISKDDVIFGTAPFHFDMSTFDIFCSLRAGCTLCVSPDTYLLFPKMLINLMDKQKITIWKGISSLLMYLARTHSLENNDIPTLKKIIFAGEVLPTKYLIEWMHRYPEKKFYNGYGPSEGTGMSTVYRVSNIPKNPIDQVPIGKARNNCEIILLNDDLTETPLGEIGEICIRGSGVSSGYWNDREKTRHVFIRNPLNDRGSDRIYRTGDLAACDSEGNITFIGRKDHQVKYMGYRIELGEIENALISLDGISDAVVFLGENSSSEEEKELVACVEVKQNFDLSHTLEELSQLLPQYMIPKKLIPVVEIPRSERGKVDRIKVMEQYSA